VFERIRGIYPALSSTIAAAWLPLGVAFVGVVVLSRVV
jgi:hypothetical protein